MYTQSKFSLGRLVKLKISFLVYLWTAAGSFLRRLFGMPIPGRCVVLYYHSIPAQQRLKFAHQLDTILLRAKPVDATHRIVPNEGELLAAVTFDDAFENFVEQALPELQKKGIPSLVFVISEALGKAFGPTGKPEKVMSTAQLDALPRPLVSIGSHTVTHPFLPELDEASALRELRDSKKQLQELLGREVGTFSFPFGGFSPRLIELCREAGYTRIFTTLPVYGFEHGPDEFAVGRVRVDPTDWGLEFFLKLHGAYRWLPTAIRIKSRLRLLMGGQPQGESSEEPRSMIQECISRS